MNNDDQFDKVRLLPLEGLYNVRDLGGYPAAGEPFGSLGTRQVAWGRLYRAGDFGNLTPQAKGYLEGRNIRTIVDFRDDDERAASPDGEIATVRNNISLPIFAANIVDLSKLKAGTDGEAVMEELYRAMVVEIRTQYRSFFRILQDRDSAPLIFHCSAGKDRTGVGAALILAALGADRETIFRDYLLTGEYLKGKYDHWLTSAPYLEPVLMVRQRYLAAAFDAIDTRFGGIESYLREEMGADIDLLRELYTTPMSGTR
ncbi:protein-tyrosine-phosphatase [Spirochaetia bacterium]|nr:protein-tyrosine-phosphatase [Spirochaetia bacterium]